MISKRDIVGIGCALLVSGCIPEFDLQGYDPNAFYAQHPVVNKVETRYATQVLHFGSNQDRLDNEQRQTLKQQFTRISPLAVNEVEVQLHPSQMANAQRQAHLVNMLSQMGVEKKQVHFVPMEEVERYDANVQVAYSAVVSPRCPDWRPSPVTSYSNMPFTPNLGCASVTNLGLMVADPHDLEEGSGDNTPDTYSTTRAVQDYREGKTPAATSATSGSEATSGSGTSTSQ